MSIRNHIESDILTKVGGADLPIGTAQNELLLAILAQYGGTQTSTTRNGILEDILAAI